MKLYLIRYHVREFFACILPPLGAVFLGVGLGLIWAGVVLAELLAGALFLCAALLVVSAALPILCAAAVGALAWYICHLLRKADRCVLLRVSL